MGERISDALRVFPDIADVRVTHAYDALPHLERSTMGRNYAFGYCGTGASRATYFGPEIALQLLGEKDGRTAFDDLTLPSFPAHPIAKHAVPAVETWYRYRDATNLLKHTGEAENVDDDYAQEHLVKQRLRGHFRLFPRGSGR